MKNENEPPKSSNTLHTMLFLFSAWHYCDCASSPDVADSSSFDVQLGDIILTATDGLFDNMPDYMILQELKKLKASQKQVCWRERTQKCL